MPMTYTSLTAAKGTAGSIANWVNYTKLDIATILDEAQSLLYSQLRVREMRSQKRFLLSQGVAKYPLPSDFLDPIGRIFLPTLNYSIPQKDQSFLTAARAYTATSGTLGANPLTTVSGSTIVAVSLLAHGMLSAKEGSVFSVSGAAAFNGVSIIGAFPITEILGPDSFSIDITDLGVTPNASGAGGGASVTYLFDTLLQGTPSCWAAFDETIHFDQRTSQSVNALLNYYKMPLALSASNQSNFLTNRYPTLLRTACQTAAADFMKDDTEYQKCGQRLAALIQAINAENDGAYRGIEIFSETP